jgi:hypothetical protein
MGRIRPIKSSAARLDQLAHGWPKHSCGRHNASAGSGDSAGASPAGRADARTAPSSPFISPARAQADRRLQRDCAPRPHNLRVAPRHSSA